MSNRSRSSALAPLRALARAGTYAGQGREVVSLAVTAGMWPLGVIDRGLAEMRQRLAPGDGPSRTPILLIHGYGANKSNWFFIQRALRDAGFDQVHALNYNPLRGGVPRLARRVVHRAEALMDHCGSDGIHLVGHSLGGILARYAVEVGGLQQARSVVTIASPHGGAPLAGLGVGQAATDLRPGSEVLGRLRTATRPPATRYVAYYSNLDLVVPGHRAMILDPAMRATNLLVKDEGHLSIMLSRRLAGSVSAELAAVEGLPGSGAAVRSLPASQPGVGESDPAVEVAAAS